MKQSERRSRRIREEAYSRVRLQLLAAQIHSLGPYPLFHLFVEIADGAQPLSRIERYARLSRERGPFIPALRGDQFPERLFVIDGNQNEFCPAD